VIAELPSNATCVALIPARSGSTRVPNKNVRELAGYPVVAYSIAAALDSGVFDAVVVSTDSASIAETARRFGAETPFTRPAELATGTSPDIEWVRHALLTLAERGRTWDCFSILRPTSPFRGPDTIRRAWQAFRDDGRADSLRAVQPCREHPGKMWLIEGHRMTPLISNPGRGATPWHSTPYQSLPPVFVQNASLEIARTATPLDHGSIAGEAIQPFLTNDLEGFDINSEDDWVLAEHHARQHPEMLPVVRAPS
jgi:N-acylneuraminate cytidylyltransferase